MFSSAIMMKNYANSSRTCSWMLPNNSIWHKSWKCVIIFFHLSIIFDIGQKMNQKLSQLQGDIFHFRVVQSGVELWAIKVWAKRDFFLLNFWRSLLLIFTYLHKNDSTALQISHAWRFDCDLINETSIFLLEIN